MTAMTMNSICVTQRALSVSQLGTIGRLLSTSLSDAAAFDQPVGLGQRCALRCKRFRRDDEFYLTIVHGVLAVPARDHRPVAISWILRHFNQIVLKSGSFHSASLQLGSRRGGTPPIDGRPKVFRAIRPVRLDILTNPVSLAVSRPSPTVFRPAAASTVLMRVRDLTSAIGVLANSGVGSVKRGSLIFPAPFTRLELGSASFRIRSVASPAGVRRNCPPGKNREIRRIEVYRYCSLQRRRR
jgi:hypothetical protein